MDDFFSDGQSGSSHESNKWSEKAWLDYVKRSDTRIAAIADVYEKCRSENFGLDEFAATIGLPGILNEDGQDSDFFQIESPDFSQDPVTLINHPIYIVSSAILIAIEKYMERLIRASNADSVEIWELAKQIHKASTLIVLAVNSTDLSEDMLAHSIYKSAVSVLNSILARIENLELAEFSHALNAVKTKAIFAIFDLRQICLNLS